MGAQTALPLQEAETLRVSTNPNREEAARWAIKEVAQLYRKAKKGVFSNTHRAEVLCTVLMRLGYIHLTEEERFNLIKEAKKEMIKDREAGRLKKALVAAELIEKANNMKSNPFLEGYCKRILFNNTLKQWAKDDFHFSVYEESGRYVELVRRLKF